MNPNSPTPKHIATALRQKLRDKQGKLHSSSLSDLVNKQGQRSYEYTLQAAGIYLDYSKNFCDDQVLSLLGQCAQQMQIKPAIEQLFNGESVNRTEGRAALHSSLRSSKPDSPHYDIIHDALLRMRSLVEQLHQGKLSGFSGKSITDIINIGIGGSDLGPRFVNSALKEYSRPDRRCHFISNIDPCALSDCLESCNPETSLLIISSKTFTTLETQENARAAKSWLQGAAHGKDIGPQLIGITADSQKAHDFGIAIDNILPMWDWVGGRFSLWSAIGLPIAFSLGWENFQSLLRGAEQMDQHYRQQPLLTNMPVILAMLEYWYISYWGAQSVAILPYSERLALLPKFMQQLSMESLGKQTDRNNQATDYPTGAVIWGEAGTTGQHSFHQLLHQGSHFIPVDFICHPGNKQQIDERHSHLLANCLSQSRALMCGKSFEQAVEELLATGQDSQSAKLLARHKTIPGNRPSNTLIMNALTPATLGAMIALYEHKIHAQSILWNINAFDQWGVELGKQYSSQLYQTLSGEKTADFDPSTNGLIRHLQSL